MSNSEPKQNRHYEAWAAATGGGPNWKCMAWIREQEKTWLTYCVNHDFGLPIFGFSEWLELQFKMTNERKNITQPADWWAAFEAQAKAEGVSLAAWLGEAAKAKLPAKVAKKLTERRAANRPAKPRD